MTLKVRVAPFQYIGNAYYKYYINFTENPKKKNKRTTDSATTTVNAVNANAKSKILEACNIVKEHNKKEFKCVGVLQNDQDLSKIFFYPTSNLPLISKPFLNCNEVIQSFNEKILKEIENNGDNEYSNDWSLKHMKHEFDQAKHNAEEEDDEDDFSNDTYANEDMYDAISRPLTPILYALFQHSGYNDNIYTVLLAVNNTEKEKRLLSVCYALQCDEENIVVSNSSIEIRLHTKKQNEEFKNSTDKIKSLIIFDEFEQIRSDIPIGTVIMPQTPITGGKCSKTIYVVHNGKKYRQQIGKRGGKYIVVNGKKHYGRPLAPPMR